MTDAQNFYLMKIQLIFFYISIWVLKGEEHKKAYELTWLHFFQFSTDFSEIFSKCWIKDILKPHKVSALLENVFFIVSKGDQRKKDSKTKNNEKSTAKWSHISFCAFPIWKFNLNLKICLKHGPQRVVPYLCILNLSCDKFEMWIFKT